MFSPESAPLARSDPDDERDAYDMTYDVERSGMSRINHPSSPQPTRSGASQSVREDDHLLGSDTKPQSHKCTLSSSKSTVARYGLTEVCCLRIMVLLMPLLVFILIMEFSKDGALARDLEQRLILSRQAARLLQEQIARAREAVLDAAASSDRMVSNGSPTLALEDHLFTSGLLLTYIPPSKYSSAWCVTSRHDRAVEVPASEPPGHQYGDHPEQRRLCLLSNVCYSREDESWKYFLDPQLPHPHNRNPTSSTFFAELMLTNRDRDVVMPIEFVESEMPYKSPSKIDHDNDEREAGPSRVASGGGGGGKGAADVEWVDLLTLHLTPFCISHPGHTFADDVLSMHDMAQTFGFQDRTDRQILLHQDDTSAETCDLAYEKWPLSLDILQSVSTRPLRCLSDLPSRQTCFSNMVVGRWLSGMGFNERVDFVGMKRTIHKVLGVHTPTSIGKSKLRVIFVYHIGKRVLVNQAEVNQHLESLAKERDFILDIIAWEHVSTWRERVEILSRTHLLITQVGTSSMFSPLLPSGSISLVICTGRTCGNELRNIHIYQSDVRTLIYSAPDHLSQVGVHVFPPLDSTGALPLKEDGSINLFNADSVLPWDDFRPSLLEAIQLAEYASNVHMQQ
jgi:hypothetical protein